MMFGDSYDIEDTAYKYYSEIDCLTSDEICAIINSERNEKECPIGATADTLG